MTTSIVITGTGVPHVSPGRAGAGVLVSYGDTHVQFDAGRATTLRLAEAGVLPHQLSALFVTHVHSDHVIDIPDLVMTRWIESNLHPAGPLPIFTARGPVEDFLASMLAPYANDIDVRVGHGQETPPVFDTHTFDAPTSTQEIWRNGDDTVIVSARAVRHEPVANAVAYRVDTPDGTIVISGDTRVCDEVGELARGAHMVIHEAARIRALSELIRNTPFENIFDYHADSVALGEHAARWGTPHLVLTHLIPPPTTPHEAAQFALDVRKGGFEGVVSVAHDLDRFILRDGQTHIDSSSDDTES